MCENRERGAIALETLYSIGIFFVVIFGIIAVSRYAFISLSMQFAASIGARVASAVGEGPPPNPDPQQCCIQRVNAIKAAVASHSNKYLVPLVADEHVFICNEAMDCNICDDASLTTMPPENVASTGPGFNRNTVLQVRVRMPVDLVFLPEFAIDRGALTKTDSSLSDCRLPAPSGVPPFL